MGGLGGGGVTLNPARGWAGGVGEFGGHSTAKVGSGALEVTAVQVPLKPRSTLPLLLGGRLRESYIEVPLEALPKYAAHHFASQFSETSMSSLSARP